MTCDDELPGLARAVSAILEDALARERAESRARGGQSPLAWVLWCLELGAIIHTTGREAPDLRAPRTRPLPPLGPEALLVARAIEEDGQGLADVTQVFGGRSVAFALEHRVGWVFATEVQRGKWAAKFAAGDSEPALAGARTLGIQRLRAFLADWEKNS